MEKKIKDKIKTISYLKEQDISIVNPNKKYIINNHQNNEPLQQKISLIGLHTFFMVISFCFLLFIYKYWSSKKSNHITESLVEVGDILYNFIPFLIPILMIMVLFRFGYRSDKRTTFFLNMTTAFFPIMLLVQLTTGWNGHQKSFEGIILFLELTSLVIGTLLLSEILLKWINFSYNKITPIQRFSYYALLFIVQTLLIPFIFIGIDYQFGKEQYFNIDTIRQATQQYGIQLIPFIPISLFIRYYTKSIRSYLFSLSLLIILLFASYYLLAFNLPFTKGNPLCYIYWTTIILLWSLLSEGIATLLLLLGIQITIKKET
ncbi:hypothetical protein [Pelistega ratti]|uniref:hypothetical protein n=1 Tax=Pelistega ratti TaxID=2652177 RepID=UPI00135CC6EA|nr:hypothetical protein [Pelistega ratti]